MIRLTAAILTAAVALVLPEPNAKWREYAGVDTLAETHAPPIYREHTIARPGDANNDGALSMADVTPFIEALAAGHGDERWPVHWYAQHLGGNPHVLDLDFDGHLTIHDAGQLSLLLREPEQYWRQHGRRYAMRVSRNLKAGLVTEAEAIKAMDYAFATLRRGD